MSTEQPIYLDYNATTPILPEVVDAMLPYLREHFGNPSSLHPAGVTARAAVEKAREHVAALLGCDPDEIFFTSGGTEANNLAIRGATEESPLDATIVTSAVEHPAVARPCAWLGRHGRTVRAVDVDWNGRIDLDAARAAIEKNALLVTVMHSNNETGVLQPVEELAAYARARDVLVHTDAAQSVGKVPIQVRALGVDLLSVAGHKLYAPKGIGALYVRRGVRIAPFLLGAGHERGLRPGTENVASIVGLGAACARARQDQNEIAVRTQHLRDLLWELLSAKVPGLALNGHAELRLPNTLNVRFPNASGNAVLRGAPEVMASTGSACHGAEEVASDVILAMGVEPADARGSVRLTLGRGTTAEDVNRAADALARSWSALQAA